MTQNVITVGASSGDAGIVAFSSRGPVHYDVTEPTGYFAKPDVVAPGYFVLSARSNESDTSEYPTRCFRALRHRHLR